MTAESRFYKIMKKTGETFAIVFMVALSYETRGLVQYSLPFLIKDLYEYRSLKFEIFGIGRYIDNNFGYRAHNNVKGFDNQKLRNTLSEAQWRKKRLGQLERKWNLRTRIPCYFHNLENRMSVYQKKLYGYTK